MHTDKLLTTVLSAYQRPYDCDQTNPILSTTTSLLATLSNPFNVTLLTSQLLLAPAIWQQAMDLNACLKILSVFSTAAIKVLEHDLKVSSGQSTREGGGLPCDDWARAVVQGADDRSARWQHLLVIGGVLLGMKTHGRQGLSGGLTLSLEAALVKATNLALQEHSTDSILGEEVAVLVLAHTFPLIRHSHKRDLSYDTLIPIMIRTMITEGYQDGYFLGAIDADIKQVMKAQFDWSPRAPSFLKLQSLASQPLMSVMGPLARVIAFGIENIRDSRRVSAVLDDLLIFSGVLAGQWRQNKLSGINSVNENSELTIDTLKITLPTLWQILKNAMFSITIILGAVISRTLVDPVLSADIVAPSIASKTLHVLRHIHFISSRLGMNSFSALTFVFLASIDILSRFPVCSRDFVKQIQPFQPGHVATHPLERNYDLYYFNVCEHFTLLLSSEENETLIVSAVLPYTKHNDRGCLEVIEAAHSAMLAVLAAPQNVTLSSKFIPMYIEALFDSFPATLSPRQLRLAFKTLLKITTPPAPLSKTQPMLPDTILELLHFQAQRASVIALPPTLAIKSDADSRLNNAGRALSEQAVLVLALVDALPFLRCSSLEEWLPLAADLLNIIQDRGMRDLCVARFWEVLENGEMDIERAAVAVGWWTSKGGREQVLLKGETQSPQNLLMSGALIDIEGSRL